jgi:hypothetical protein
MAIKTIGYSTEVSTGQIVEAPHVSQSIDAFSAANQQDYDISISGSFKVTGSQFIEPDTLLTQNKHFILSYDSDTGQIFKMNTASIDDGDEAQEVYTTGSNNTNIIPEKFGTFDNTGTNSAIASGDFNKITSACSFIGGGIRNTASGNVSFIGGGTNNIIPTTAACSVIVGGSSNIMCNNSSRAFIGGGFKNTASNACDFIGGGNSNSITYSQYGHNTIVNGINNTICGQNTSGNYILVGTNNTVSSDYVGSNGIVSGTGNTVSTNYDIALNQITSGQCNTISGYNIKFSTIGGGCCNTISAYTANSHIMGGVCNATNGNCQFIIGSNIIASSSAACTTFVNNLTVSGSAAGTSIVIMRGLPSSDPSNVDQLWNDGGTLKVSAG